jgi:hypothetical protein
VPSYWILADLLTVALLLLVLVMVWRCWNLPPAPAIRFWALGFAGMSANYLDQLWRAEAWKRECEKLELQIENLRHQIRPPPKKSFVENASILDVDARFVLSMSGKHHTLGTTPAVAAGIEEKPWSLERVVEMTADYISGKNCSPKWNPSSLS